VVILHLDKSGSRQPIDAALNLKVSRNRTIDVVGRGIEIVQSRRAILRAVRDRKEHPRTSEGSNWLIRANSV